MARNEEKHYGRLNRLYLLKEKEEYEKKHPHRPKLDSLYSAEEIQKWLPSIKRDLDFYLKKSQVTCYSDQHIEECRMKVVKLEGEYKAFVRKLRQLSSGTLDAIPWTNRAYKRKNSDAVEPIPRKGFVPISCPALKKDTPGDKIKDSAPLIDLPLMDEPLQFSSPQHYSNPLDTFSLEHCDAKKLNYKIVENLKSDFNECGPRTSQSMDSNPNSSLVTYEDSSEGDDS